LGLSGWEEAVLDGEDVGGTEMEGSIAVEVEVKVEGRVAFFFEEAVTGIEVVCGPAMVD
jgi:hypothetical protein